MGKKISIVIIALVVLYLTITTIYQYPPQKGKSKEGEWTVWIQRDATDPKHTYSGYFTSPRMLEYEDVKYLYESDSSEDLGYINCEFDTDGYDKKNPIILSTLLDCKTRERYMFLTYAPELGEGEKEQITIKWKDNGVQKKETIKLR